MLTLRPFNHSDGDYEIMAAIYRAANPATRRRAKDYKRIDGYTPQDKFDWERTIAEWNGAPVGCGMYCRALWYSEPGLYYVNFVTHPDFRRRGIGSAFWQHLQANVLPERDVKALLAETRSQPPDGNLFVQNRGFTQTMKTTESELDLTTFDPTPYEPLLAKFAARGIVLKPLSELMETDADYLDKLVALSRVRTEDEPTTEALESFSAEKFRDYYMSSDTFYPEGWYIAVDGERYVGWCAVLPNPNRPEHVRNGVTVIERDHRRKGLATAMKVHLIKHAQSMGATKITTTNVSINPMLQINLKLGYKPTVYLYEFKKTL